MLQEQENIINNCYDLDDKSLSELANGYFSQHTLQIIDKYINDILNGRTNLHQFDLQEHAGLCTAGAPLIGAYAVCHYARRCLAASGDASARQGSLANRPALTVS